MKKEINVYMFVDALGWEIANRFSFLKDELPNRRKVQMQFGYSSTAVPTILSGAKPSEHGHFSFFYYDPVNSPFKIFKYMKYFFGAGLHPRCFFNRGRVRRKISKLFAWWKNYTGYFQLYEVSYNKLPYFNYCEKNDIFAAGGLAPVKNLRDVLIEENVPYHMSDWRKPEAQNIKEALSAIESGKIDFAFIYTAALDGFLHDNVGDEKAIAQRLKYYEDLAKSILDALKKTGRKFSFTIISDHGMTKKTGVQDVQKILDSLGLKFGKDYISITDATMLRLWYLNDTAKEIIRARFSKPDCLGAFVSQEEKVRYGIDFKNAKFGEDIFLMQDGVQIEPSDLGKKSLNGMHGFSPLAPDSYASYLSTKAPEFEPQTVADFFRLMKSDIEKVAK